MEYNPLLVGENLRNLRKLHHLTQMELAEQLDISFIHYSQIEQGRHRISMNLLFRIMALFQVDANNILGIKISKETEGLLPKIQNFINNLPQEEQKQIYTICERILDIYNRKKERSNKNAKKEI